MKIIIDNKIPFIKEAVQRIADKVVYVPGKDFTPELVRDADALIVRTRTHCNRDLLEGSRVKFIATATIGFDHIDTEYCKQAGIEWTNAPGCNSASVAQYIQSSLLVWKSCRNKKLNELTIGIIGVGNVGSKVAKVARDFGMRVLLNDLPREENVISLPFTYLYIRKGNIKPSTWQMRTSSSHSNENRLSLIPPEERSLTPMLF